MPHRQGLPRRLSPEIRPRSGRCHPGALCGRVPQPQEVSGMKAPERALSLETSVRSRAFAGMIAPDASSCWALGGSPCPHRATVGRRILFPDAGVAGCTTWRWFGVVERVARFDAQTRVAGFLMPGAGIVRAARSRQSCRRNEAPTRALLDCHPRRAVKQLYPCRRNYAPTRALLAGRRLVPEAPQCKPVAGIRPPARALLVG